MDPLTFLIVLGATVMTAGPGLLILVWALRRRPRWAVLAAVATVAGGIWWIELYRAITGAGDLEGMFDCYPYCSTSQEAAGVVLFYLPVAMGSVLFILLLIRFVRGIRARVLDARRAPTQ